MLLDFQKKIIESPLNILLAIIVLQSIGILTLYSITVTQGLQSPNALSKQLIFLIPAFLLMITMLLISKRIIHKYIYYVYGIIRFQFRGSI